MSDGVELIDGPPQEEDRPAYKIEVEGRHGSWTQTANGGRFFPLDPRPEDFGDVRVLAEQLAKKPRFSGATPGVFYGNAEHCVLVSKWAERKAPNRIRCAVAWHGLFHDAADAWLTDVPRPIKYDVRCMYEGYRPIEHAVTAAIYEAYAIRVTEEVELAVKVADREVLARECDLLVNPEWSMMPGYESADVAVRALEWRQAMDLWLARYVEIGGSLP